MRGTAALLYAARQLERVLLEQLGKLLLQRSDFRDVANLDIGVMRVLEGVVLVVVLAGEELDERRDLRDDGAGKNVRGVELLHVGFGNFALLLGGGEDVRAVLRAGIGALAIKLRGVVHDGEKDAQQRAK